MISCSEKMFICDSCEKFHPTVKQIDFGEELPVKTVCLCDECMQILRDELIRWTSDSHRGRDYAF